MASPTRRYRLFVLALLSASLGFAETEIKLWPAPVAKHTAAESAEDKHETGRVDRWISYVSEPTLTLYPAAHTEQPTPAMLVVPGGGYRTVCIDKEGIEPAQWLVAHGVTAIVLKYRTLDPKGERSSKTIVPIFADTPRAMRVVRSHAAEWHIDPNRIGVLGFSAGAVMALQLTIDADEGKHSAEDPIERIDSHPNAVAFIYGGLPGPGKLKVPSHVPPFFIVHAADDPKAPVGVVQTVTKYVQEGGGTFEAHVFAHGDHGFGMQPAKGGVRAWPDLYAAWLTELGFVSIAVDKR